MKSIFSDVQLRKKLLEELGWEMVGQGMWEKKPELPAPEERVDEDDVLEMESKRIERIQEVFEALNEICEAGPERGDPGITNPTGMVDAIGSQGPSVDEDTNEKIARCFEMLHHLDSAVTKSIKNTNVRLEALELASTAWRGVNGRLTTVEGQIKMVFNVFESLHLAIMRAVNTAFTLRETTTHEETTERSTATEVRERKDG
jgi:hypothetical protein